MTTQSNDVVTKAFVDALDRPVHFNLGGAFPTVQPELKQSDVLERLVKELEKKRKALSEYGHKEAALAVEAVRLSITIALQDD